jgi:hypothetical protein
VKEFYSEQRMYNKKRIVISSQIKYVQYDEKYFHRKLNRLIKMIIGGVIMKKAKLKHISYFFLKDNLRISLKD